MTREQRIAALMLDKCRFLPASFDKRFARSMCSMAVSTPDVELTDRQVAYLARMTRRYRKQLASVVIPNDQELEAKP